MKILSKEFKNYTKIPERFTCEGVGINPELSFENVPKDAKSLVLIMDDPDVPSDVREDNMWVHWLIWNIDPKLKVIEENSTPKGVYGITTSKTLSYVGPCPPDKEHRYFFKLYALDSLIDLKEGSTKEELLNAINGKITEKAELIGLYCKEENK